MTDSVYTRSANYIIVYIPACMQLVFHKAKTAVKKRRCCVLPKNPRQLYSYLSALLDKKKFRAYDNNAGAYKRTNLGN